MARRDLIVIGGSAGSLEAIQEFLPLLPTGLPVSILITIHTRQDRSSHLAEVINRKTDWLAKHPSNGGKMKPGHIYVAPNNLHLLVVDGYMLLRDGPRQNLHRPAIDPLFQSAARRHGSGVIGVLLSGLMADGVSGLLEIQQKGGYTIVQEPSSAGFSALPQSALDYFSPDAVLTPKEIPRRLSELVSDKVSVQPAEEPELDITDLEEVLLTEIKDQPGEPTDFACPDCGSGLWQTEVRGFVRFRCHIGHTYTSEQLLSQQTDSIERCYWKILRLLKERASLQYMLADEATLAEVHSSADHYSQHAQLDRKRLKLMQEHLKLGRPW